MPNTMKITVATLASLTLIPAAATAAYTVKAPHPGTVTTTTYYPSGRYHGAVDISSGRCNYWGVQTGVVGSLYWNVTIRTSGVHCTGTGSGTQNEANHVPSSPLASPCFHDTAGTPAWENPSCHER